MDHDKWVENFCQCGTDKNGKWSEELFAEAGCNCRENLPAYGYVWSDGELVEVEA